MSFIGILLLDYIILPNYVGYNNEHYLPDVRGEYVEKASYHMRTLGFHTELVVVPYSEKYIPGTVKACEILSGPSTILPSPKFQVANA